MRRHSKLSQALYILAPTLLIVAVFSQAAEAAVVNLRRYNFKTFTAEDYLGRDAAGHIVIPVCIDDRSSTQQRNGGVVHARNPSLEDVVSRIRRALHLSWERYSAIRFEDFRRCSAIPSEHRFQRYIKLYIHKDQPHRFSSGNDTAAVDDIPRLGLIRMKPWGNGGQCIKYNWSTARNEYRYDCAEQYAIHEFGHAIGFEHEWRNPARPASCTEGTVVPTRLASPSYPVSGLNYYIPNLAQYDYDSIMTYTPECADVTGVRFGSKSLSKVDILAVSTVYPMPRQNDACNPGLFDNNRWYCAADSSLPVGSTCSTEWKQCTPGCNPGPVDGEWYTCSSHPRLQTGNFCPSGWDFCRIDDYQAPTPDGVCNPGVFDDQRWFCEGDPSAVAGQDSCPAGWRPCRPGCNPGALNNQTWLCPLDTRAIVGIESCDTGWEICR